MRCAELRSIGVHRVLGDCESALRGDVGNVCSCDAGDPIVAAVWTFMWRSERCSFI